MSAAAYEQFGPYILEKRLGSGGAATVYKAFDSENQRYVGLKVLHEHLAAHEDTVKRFRLEAQIAQRLDHPNIVPIYHIGRIDGKPFITMPYMDGGSLADRFEKPTSVSLNASARLLREIAGALDHAHSKQIIHRDIKLENILLDENNRPVIGDFGIARVLTATRMTVTGDVLGTPHYMSPEQWLGDPDNIDHRSDLYSFAVMAYLMATGYYPFTAEHVMGFMHDHLSKEPPLPSEVAPNLPKALDPVMLRGLAKNPRDRYQTAMEFARAFRQATSAHADHKTIVHITGINPIVPSKTIASALPTIEKPQPLWRRLMIWVVLMVAILAALTAGMYANRPQPPDPVSVVNAFAARLTETAIMFTAIPTGPPTNDPNAIVADAMNRLTQTALARPTQTPSDTPTRTRIPTQTRTPSPTASPLPSPSPAPTEIPAFSLGNTAVVSYPAGIELIRGPGNQYSRVGALPVGTRLLMIGRTQDSIWLHIVTDDGRVGWVQRGYLAVNDNLIPGLDVTWQDSQSIAALPPTSISVPTAAPQNQNEQPRPTATLHPRYQRYLDEIRSGDYSFVPLLFAENAPDSFRNNLDDHDVYWDNSFLCQGNQQCQIWGAGGCRVIDPNQNTILEWVMLYVTSERGLRYLINSPHVEVESTFDGESFVDKHVPNFDPETYQLGCVA